MQFASPTRNNNIRDCQKTSNYKKDRLVAGQLLQNRRETVPHLRIGWIQNGEWSSSIKQHCSRRLKEAGLVAHVDMQKPLLTAVPHRKRLQFAMAHTDWTWVDWSIMIVLGVMGQDSLSFKMMVVCL
ncbi:uncharacterized protein LOC111115306 [Crassostrea virginica]